MLLETKGGMEFGSWTRGAEFQALVGLRLVEGLLIELLVGLSRTTKHVQNTSAVQTPQQVFFAMLNYLNLPDLMTSNLNLTPSNFLL